MSQWWHMSFSDDPDKSTDYGIPVYISPGGDWELADSIRMTVIKGVWDASDVPTAGRGGCLCYQGNAKVTDDHLFKLNDFKPMGVNFNTGAVGYRKGDTGTGVWNNVPRRAAGQSLPKNPNRSTHSRESESAPSYRHFS